MTSGQYITYFMYAVLIIFTIWELIQLYRRRKGNESAFTMSQYVERKAKKSKRWAYWNLIFALLITVVGIWLIFHWLTLCYTFGLFCEVDI